MGKLYAQGRGRITELVSDLNEEQAGARVPTCPRWTVRDVVAHVTGVCADILAGNVVGVATDPWTDAQVQARKERSLAELVAEWSELAPQVEAIAQFFPGRVATQWMFDLTSHEHDVRLGLGRPGARDAEAIKVSAQFLIDVGLRSSVATRGLPPIEVQTDLGAWIVGTDEPRAAELEDADEAKLRLAGDRQSGDVLAGADPIAPEGVLPVGRVSLPAFELVRAVGGRRSFDQIRAWDWTIDPEPYLPAFQFGPFTMSATDIAE
jgi:uncharacterized protein (TIGR03083 family)